MRKSYVYECSFCGKKIKNFNPDIHQINFPPNSHLEFCLKCQIKSINQFISFEDLVPKISHIEFGQYLKAILLWRLFGKNNYNEIEAEINAKNATEKEIYPQEFWPKIDIDLHCWLSYFYRYKHMLDKMSEKYIFKDEIAKIVNDFFEHIKDHEKREKMISTIDNDNLSDKEQMEILDQILYPDNE